MSRRVIRTVDGQVFSDSPGRFQDSKGEILYKRGFFNTVRINKRSITSDDNSGTSPTLVLAIAVMIFVVVLAALSVISMTSGRLSSDSIRPNSDVASNNTMANPKPKAIAETKVEVIVDIKSNTFHLPNCPQIREVEQHFKRTYDKQQAQSFGHKNHDACSK